MPASALLLALAWSVHAQQPAPSSMNRQPAVPRDTAPPLVDAAVTDDAARFRLGGDLLKSPLFELAPYVRGGLLAPFGTPGASYPTLLPSPFGLIGVRLGVTGTVEGLVTASHGFLDLKSQSPFGAASRAMTSPANSLPGRESFDQRLGVTSVHADVGKAFSLGGAWKAAVFAASDSWLSKPLEDAKYGADGRVEGSGGVVLMGRRGGYDLTLSAAAQVEDAPKTRWRNYEYALLPSAVAGVEIGTGQSVRVAAGAEFQSSRAEQSLRPYVSADSTRVGATLAGDFRRGQNPFYPDVTGGGLELRYALRDNMTLDAKASVFQERYAMAPEPTNGYRALVGLTIDLGEKVRVRTSRAAADDASRRAFDLERAAALDRSISGNKGDRNAFQDAFKRANTLDEFLAAMPAGNADRILSTVSQVTDLIGRYNYNVEESENPNVNDAREFYTRVRQSALTGTKDPITVCIGSAQFGAMLAEELGRRWGVEVAATAPSVRVPNRQGVGSGHAVTAIKTREHGIVFVDWGRLTPTYTWNTKEALRVYQALVGIPAFTHDITEGPDGRLAGTLFTEEGKMFVRELTAYGELPQPVLERLFNDAPQSATRALERYRRILRARP